PGLVAHRVDEGGAARHRRAARARRRGEVARAAVGALVDEAEMREAVAIPAVEPADHRLRVMLGEGPEAELVPLVFEDVPGLAVLVELPARHLEAGHEKVAGGARVDHHVARGVAGIETLRLGLDGFVLVLDEEPAGDAAGDAALSERQALGDLGDEVAEVPEREDALVPVPVIELPARLP